MKPFYKLVILFSVLFFSACSVEPLKPVTVQEKFHEVNYLDDVKPILDKRCVVCHSCYNSPCQLKLSSYGGIARGASKEKVYMGERIFEAEPTRLFVDASSTQEWRAKGFFGVTDSNTTKGTNNSIMLQLLHHKMKQPKSLGEYFSESDDLTCSKDIEELSEFLDDNPNKGMPYGFPALTQKEYLTLQSWLYQGGEESLNEKQKLSEQPSKKAQKQIEKFEAFLNDPDSKNVMSARYIFEHLYLAHLNFQTSPNEFFKLVRSYTPSNKMIQVVKTIRPYENPQGKIYYRFRKINSTVVHKTHMVYDLSDAKLERWKELFIDVPWEEKPHVIGYEKSFNANPFEVFAQIPAKSRYEFLLDNAEYMVRTFIRGPVCKGQIALNVIHDHFWVMFMHPAYDLSVQNKEFLKEEFNNLRLPIEEGSQVEVYRTFSDKYNDFAKNYEKQRAALYDKVYPKSLGIESIWSGKDGSSSPFLTIYRHFDSASVHKGALGNLPRTAWIIDYPLFERIYYALVVGFDVFGNVGHQVGIRRYMDRLRIEGESNFLNMLPLEDREKVFASWYIDYEVDHFLSKNETATVYTKIDSKREFLENVIDHHLLKSCGIGFDFLNYRRANERVVKLPKVFRTKQDYTDGFKSLTKAGTPFIRLVNGTNSNLAYIRIMMPNGKDVVVSAVVNRWHDNVSFMFDEQSRLDPSKDTLEFIEGFIGSYPNYFFEVKQEELPDFFDMIKNYDGSDKYRAKFLKYGVDRGSKKFWKSYDWFQNRFKEENPHTWGLFDLNRYYYKVLQK